LEKTSSKSCKKTRSKRQKLVARNETTNKSLQSIRLVVSKKTEENLVMVNQTDLVSLTFLATAKAVNHRKQQTAPKKRCAILLSRKYLYLALYRRFSQGRWK